MRLSGLGQVWHFTLGPCLDPKAFLRVLGVRPRALSVSARLLAMGSVVQLARGLGEYTGQSRPGCIPP